ncbi:hypothetical protein BC629DRAFT_237839 [Irpex lacteus]|nr:hypothetical protein BC629DRAFT_237839 [Irpex lacteus]
MATGADIPPELVEQILLDVCEGAWRLLDLDETVPNRKDAIKNVTACSLTCVYWAHICRKQLFCSVRIKNYEDMRAFVSLVVNTPTRFAPISEYVFYATLVQRVGDRPWLYLFRIQSCLTRLLQSSRIDFHIEDSPNYGTGPQRSISQRLFASLPRTPPSSCLQCEDLIIDKPHFVTPHDLASFLRKFSRFDSLRLTNVTWSAQVDFASDLLVWNPLDVSRWFDVRVYSSKYTLETTWLALITMLRYSLDERVVQLQVLPSAQQVILDISGCLCQGHEAPFLRFYRYTNSRPYGISVRNTKVCE